jgi:hypothetical protein
MMHTIKAAALWSALAVATLVLAAAFSFGRAAEQNCNPNPCNEFGVSRDWKDTAPTGLHTEIRDGKMLWCEQTECAPAATFIYHRAPGVTEHCAGYPMTCVRQGRR